MTDSRWRGVSVSIEYQCDEEDDEACLEEFAKRIVALTDHTPYSAHWYNHKDKTLESLSPGERVLLRVWREEVAKSKARTKEG